MMSTKPTTLRLGFAGAGVLMCVVGFVGCTDNPPPPVPTRPPVALGPVEVTGVGDIAQGGASGNELVLQLTEAGIATIAAGTGSLQVTLTDHAGLPDTLRFTGTPSVVAPGSLGASAVLNGGNVLTISIVDSDRFNIEPIIITGLAISASPSAALGSINAVIGGCAGSLAGCVAANVLASPGSVVAAQ
jgi:hypothetical protein